jgi:diguanylate cyclase (GGDEF)-like protein/putative nucleotidyltransferase with HDIG domain
LTDEDTVRFSAITAGHFLPGSAVTPVGLTGDGVHDLGQVMPDIWLVDGQIVNTLSARRWKAARALCHSVVMVHPERVDAARLKEVDGIVDLDWSPAVISAWLAHLATHRREWTRTRDRMRRLSRRYHGLQTQLQVNTYLYDMLRELVTATQDVIPGLQKVAAGLGAFFNAESIRIVVVDAVSRQLVEGATWGGDAVEAYEWSVGPIGQAADRAEAVKAGPTTAFPLIHDGAVLGVLAVTRSGRSAAYTKSDMQLVQEATNQLAIALLKGQLYSAIKELAVRDGLTHIYNRSYFQNALQDEMAKAKRLEYRMSVLMVDVDYFKSFNDAYGHLVGDEILKRIARVLETSVHSGDVVARFGGEEFVCLIKGGSTGATMDLAQKMRARVQSLALYAVHIRSASGNTRHMLVEREPDGNLHCLLFPLMTAAHESAETAAVERDWIESIWLKKIEKDLAARKVGLVSPQRKLQIEPLEITVSIGVSTYPDDFSRKSASSRRLESAAEDQDLLLYMADKALYKAKKLGRNRVLTYDEVQNSGLAEPNRALEGEAVRELLTLLRRKDENTYAHSLRVGRMAELLAKKAGLDADMQHVTGLAGYLHDVGKTVIADTILKKDGLLTPEEYAIMKTHAAKGAELLNKYPPLHAAINGVRHHHERWEGNGYPEGLEGERIPMEARIIAIVDSYDAITRSRPYHPQKPTDVAYAQDEIRKNAGIMYDPRLVDCFFAHYDALVGVQNMGQDIEFH